MSGKFLDRILYLYFSYPKSNNIFHLFFIFFLVHIFCFSVRNKQNKWTTWYFYLDFIMRLLRRGTTNNNKNEKKKTIQATMPSMIECGWYILKRVWYTNISYTPTQTNEIGPETNVHLKCYMHNDQQYFVYIENLFIFSSFVHFHEIRIIN